MKCHTGVIRDILVRRQSLLSLPEHFVPTMPVRHLRALE